MFQGFFQSVRAISSSRISCNRWSRRSWSAAAPPSLLCICVRFASLISAISSRSFLIRSDTNFGINSLMKLGSSCHVKNRSRRSKASRLCEKRFCFWLCQKMSHIEQEPTKDRSSTHWITAARIGFQHSENFGFCISGIPKNTNSIGMRAKAHNRGLMEFRTLCDRRRSKCFASSVAFRRNQSLSASSYLGH